MTDLSRASLPSFMIIEVRKAGFVNKGAYLMLLSIAQQIRRRYPAATLTMIPSTRKGTQPFESLVRQGFLPKASLIRGGLQWGDLVALLPSRLREMYGLVRDSEVDGVLDAAGFAYGTPWSPAAMQELAFSARRWRRQGSALVLLPQAFGEMPGRRYRKLAREVVRCADWVFARDYESLRHLTAAVGERPNISVSPDFTANTVGIAPSDPSIWQHIIAIVPNARMLDQTAPEIRDAYVPFLADCVRLIEAGGGCPRIIVHEEREDMAIAENLLGSHRPGDIVIEPDPLRLKGLLGACRGAIGSRFHALANCLSQGVPAFGTGWSHKYRALFSDYDFPEGLLSSLSTESASQTVAYLMDDQWTSATRRSLLAKSATQSLQIDAMWTRVFALLDSAGARRQFG